MAPSIESFPSSDLPWKIQTLPNGKRRKGGAIDLSECELMELVQYSCRLKGHSSSPQSVIQCEPIVKLFRRYEPVPTPSSSDLNTDRRRCAGGLMVETTSFETEPSVDT